MAEAEILGLSPGFVFEPSDGDLVEHFLLPRLLGQPLPLEGIIIDDDPRSAPPWKLLARNGRGNVDDAYFFAPADTAKNRQGRRACVGGGTWVGQKVEARGELHLDDEQTMAWQKYRLNFHLRSGGKIRSGSTGWIMLEYSVVVPDGASFKICHISFTGYGQQRKRVPDGYVDSDFAAAAAVSTTAVQGCHQEMLLQQPVAYNNVDAAAAHADTIPWSTEQQASRAQIVLEQEQPPLLDPGFFDFTTDFMPVTEHGTMPASMDHETGTPEQNGTMQQQASRTQIVLEQEQPPLLDPDFFDFTTDFMPVTEHGTMPASMDHETGTPEQNGTMQQQASRTQIVLEQEQPPLLDPGFFDFTTDFMPVTEHGTMPASMDHETGTPELNGTMQQQASRTQIVLEQEQPPLLDPGFFDFTTDFMPVTEHGTMPASMDHETGTPEQNGTMPAPMQMDQETGVQELLMEVDDPMMRLVFESLGEFATAAQTNADFRDYWADAGQDIL